MGQELLPCPAPWCTRAVPPVIEQANLQVRWFIGCPCCGISTPCYPTEAEAITAWNQRASTPPDGEGVTISREAFDFLMGHGPLEGQYFSDDHPERKGRFWWRSAIRESSGLFTKGTPPDGEIGALVERLRHEAEMLEQQASTATRSVPALQERDRKSFAAEAAQRRREINALEAFAAHQDLDKLQSAEAFADVAMAAARDEYRALYEEELTKLRSHQEELLSAEREACAQIADEVWNEAARHIESYGTNNLTWRRQAEIADRIRDTIRARGDKPEVGL